MNLVSGILEFVVASLFGGLSAILCDDVVDYLHVEGCHERCRRRVQTFVDALRFDF